MRTKVFLFVVIIFIFIQACQRQAKYSFVAVNECYVGEIVKADTEPPDKSEYFSYEETTQSKFVGNVVIDTREITEDEAQLKLQQFALKKVGFCGNDEGIVPERLTIFSTKPDRVTLTVFTQGLHDDSVASEEGRMDFVYQDDEWKVEWAGARWGCMPGRGHQYLSGEKCF